MSPEKSELDMETERLSAIVGEAREHLGPEAAGRRVAWDELDARLFARIEAESRGAARAEAARSRLGGGRTWAGVAAALAMAAAIPLVATHATRTATFESIGASLHESGSAGALAWKEGVGEVRIGDPGGALLAATAGSALVRGDDVETSGARGIFRRGADGKPGSVVWAVEDHARLSVTRTHGALVLALARGALEAQVTPVASGEAFAVDVDAVRVAVHGTHLRVARDGTHVTVDLTEGVVSIGVPPRAGSTYGNLINAPAHIEFDAFDPSGTLKVTHDPARVRAALALRTAPEAAVAVTPRVAEAASEPSPRPAPHAVAAAARPHESALVSPNPSSAGDQRSPEAPEQAILRAVRACAASHAGDHANDVVVTISSKLELHVRDDGHVELARFEPPLSPEVQACASKVIYDVRFANGGTRTLPIDLQR